MDAKELETQLKEYFGNTFTLEAICNPENTQTRINMLKIFLNKYLNYDVERILSTTREYLRNKENTHTFNEYNNVLLVFSLIGNHTLSGFGIKNFMMTDITLPDGKRWFKILSELVKALNLMKREKAIYDQFRTKIVDIVAMSQNNSMKIELLQENIDNANNQLALYNEANDSEKYLEIENADKFVKKNLEINSIEQENLKKSLIAIEEKINILAIKTNKLVSNNKRLEENIIASPDYLLEDISCASKQILDENKIKEEVINKHKLAKENIALIEEHLAIIPKISDPINFKEKLTKEIKFIKQEIEKVESDISKEMQKIQITTSQIKEQKLKNGKVKEKLEQMTFAHQNKIEKLNLESLNCMLDDAKKYVKILELKIQQLQKEINQAQHNSQEWQMKMEQLQKLDNERYDELLEMAKSYLSKCSAPSSDKLDKIVQRLVALK